MAKKVKATVKIGTDVKTVTMFVKDNVTELEVKTIIEKLSKGVVTEVGFIYKSGIFHDPIPPATQDDRHATTFMVKEKKSDQVSFVTIPYVKHLPTNEYMAELQTYLSCNQLDDLSPDSMTIYKNV